MSSIATAGTTQGAATLLTGARWYEVTITDPNTDNAARLPPAASVSLDTPLVLWVLDGTNRPQLSLFPASGETIDGGAADAEISPQITGGEMAILFSDGVSAWMTVKGTPWYGSALDDYYPMIEATFQDLSGHFSFDGAGGGFITLSAANGNFTVLLDWQTQTANLVLCGPASGGAAKPTFRALVSDDIPNLAASKITSGTLAVAQGGTNAATASANQGFFGPTSGGAAAPSFRALVAADVPAIPASKFTAVSTGLTATGTNQATALALAETASIMIHEVTGGGSGTGIILPAGTPGNIHWVRNKKGSVLNIYPPSGGTIDALAVDANQTIPNNQLYPFVCTAAGVYYSTK